MSVLDQLRAIEQQVEKRLRELAPLVAEFRDLEKVAERLGLKRDAPQPSDTSAAKPAGGAKPKPPRARTRTTQTTKSRAPERKATPTASKTAPAGASSDAASARRRSRAAASKRAAAKPKPKPTAASGDTAAAEGTTTPRSRRAAAAPGQRQQDVLRLVSERPGITIAELAQELSVDATGLYGVVRRLQTKGQISKDGTALRPIETALSPEPTPATPPAAASSSTPDSPEPLSEPPSTDS